MFNERFDDSRDNVLVGEIVIELALRVDLRKLDSEILHHLLVSSHVVGAVALLGEGHHTVFLDLPQEDALYGLGERGG